MAAPIPSAIRKPQSALGAAVMLAGCTGPQHVLEPRGPAAARIAELWWLMFGIAGVVTLVVAVLLGLAIARGRARALERPRAPIAGSRLVWIGGVIVPLAVVAALVVWTARVGTAIYRPATEVADALTIEVIGHQYWWEVRYPDHGIETANEIYLPAGEPVLVRVSSPDVIHSFWVPQLHGKIDMIPGRWNQLWLQADEPGLFRGQCAEYCGEGHALMAFWVEALPPAAFEEWLRQRATPQPEPLEPQIRLGRDVFFEAQCHQCHATRGDPLPPEFGTVGPNLTDFGRRRTLGAGLRPNNAGTLAAWITDPEAMKPGVRMPPTRLDGERLQALVAYLLSLQ